MSAVDYVLDEVAIIAGHFPWLPPTPKPHGRPIAYRQWARGFASPQRGGEALAESRKRNDRRRALYRAEKEERGLGAVRNWVRTGG